MSSNTSNSKNYIKTYLWQGVSLLMRFLTLFIVVPFLSSEPKIYGIYSVCISVLIFLNYADLGFLSSSVKFAAENYAKANRKEEMRFIGFGTFILLIFSVLLSITFLFYSWNPNKLVDGLDTLELRSIASKMLLILSVFTPLIVFQRTVSIIFNIRLKGYVNKIVSIISSIIAILSTFYFFSKGRYLIVEYFLFFQSLNFLSTLVMFFLAKRNFNYKIFRLLKDIKFDKGIYVKSKKLAFSSLVTMVSWVCFYEMDQVVIGRFLGAEKVAIFAVSIMFATLFRSIFSIVFTPFNVRANYYAGKDDDQGLKDFVKRILLLTAPITILPTIAISFMSESLILSWVGEDYLESVSMVRLFSLLFTLSFLTYTVSSYLVAKQKVKEMYYMAISMPIIYWIGVYLSYPFLGLDAFPVLKLVTVFVSIIYYMIILKNEINFHWSFIFKGILGRMILPISFVIFILWYSMMYLSVEKNKLNFLLNLTIICFAVVFGFIVYYLNSKDVRDLSRTILKEFKK